MSGNLPSVRKPPCNRTLGIEIECCVKGMGDRKYKHHGFFYADDDGSVSCGRLGWDYSTCEFVSQPLTLSWMHRELTKLNKKFEWEVNDTCGIHVHVSRQWLGTNKAKAIYAWLQTQDKEDINELFGRRPNNYCKVDLEWGRSRYLAVNNENKHTIEFRGFASGKDAWPHWCVDFVTYLINHAYHLNIEAVTAYYPWWWDNESKKFIPPVKKEETTELIQVFRETAEVPAALTLGELLRERMAQPQW